MGKGVMFMLFMWLMVCLAGGVLSGHTEFAATTLTIAVDEDDAVLTVASTTGFPSKGVIALEDENISYSAKTDTTFQGILAQPLYRGTQGTEAASHAVGTVVSLAPASMMGMSAAYDVVALTDTAGPRAVVVAPLALFRLLGAFFLPHLEFLGSNLAIITYLWMVLVIGMIVALAVSLFGR
jgi:hypothetical protein